MLFIQDHNLLFPIPKKNIVFNIHHIMIQNQYFFLVKSSNLIDIIKSISVIIDLQLNSTGNS